MGAWDVGPFDNDDAGDWAGDLAESAEPAVLIGALLDEVMRSEYVEVTQANQVVATAAWLAAAVPGGPPADSPYAPDTSPLAVGPALATLVVAAVERATGEGFEWRDLWDEAGSSQAALAAVAPALDTLRGVGR